MEGALTCLNQLKMGSGKVEVAQTRGANLIPYWKEGNASRWTRIQVIVLITIVVILHFLSLPFLKMVARRVEDEINVNCVFRMLWASRTMAQRAPTVCKNSSGSASFWVGW